MSDRLDSLKEYAGLFSKGLILEMAPGIAGGIVNELCHEWNLNIAKVTEDIRENKSFWFKMDAEQHEQLRVLAEKLGEVDFLTPDVVINGIKKDFSGIASLFINWEPAMKWLTEQVEDIKSKIQE